MKNTTTIAVLLSLTAVAGLAATDAYAQSNSERIASIDERTSDIEDTTNDISASITSLTTVVSAVQTSLADLATTIQGIASSIAGVQTSVDGVAGDLSVISSKISNMDSAMAGITAIDARLTGIEGQIGTLQVSVDGIDTGDDVMTMQALAAINSRLDATNSRINDVFDRLSNIEATLLITNQKIEQPAPAPAPSPIGGQLLDGEAELNVNTYHYVRHGDATTERGASYYELDMTFSCNKDVYLTKVDLAQELDIGEYLSRLTDYNTPADVKAAANNFVKVDGRDLYNNKFETGTDTFAELNRPIDFTPNKLLTAETPLRFTSTLYDGQFDTGKVLATDGTNYNLIKDSNKTETENSPLYEINVEYIAFETGVVCSINFGSAGATQPGLTSTQTLTYGVQIHKDDIPDSVALKDYKDKIDCDGDPVQINKITAGTTGKWGLAGFAKVVLTVGSDEYTLKFDPAATTPEIINQDDVLPLYVGNEDLVVSGTIAVENLLLSIQYDTIPNATCEAVPDPAYAPAS